MNDSWNEDNSIKNFIMEEPLSEEPKVGYVPSEIDFVFSDETNKETLIGYELNEDELLRKMKSENFPVSVKICDSFWVSDGISIDYKNWDSKTPIFISAQTGRGKNTFIEHVLIPYLKSLNYVQNTKSEILILSNRIALQTQVKDRIEKSGIAKVLLYQSFLSIADNRTFLEKFEYVICDECHFFTSDSTFNPTTALILDKLIRGFQHATRIYMSSTFTDCLPYLFRYEKEIHGLLNPTPFTYKKGVVHPPYDLTFKYFLFERDYSYFNIRYYANHSDLRNIIIESIINTEKWLIFIDSRKQCKQLKNVLLEYYDEKYGSQLSDDEKALTDKDIKLIDASSKDDDEYMESISAEKFDCKILISTSVIDNGVNIKDSDLKHVVISDINKSKCLQMVGRKRVEHGEPVNLYVKVFCEEYINDRIVDLEYQKEIYGIYNRAYDNNYNTKNKPSEILNAKREFYNKHYNNGISDFENAKRWFYRDDQHPEIVKPNEIAVSLVDSVLIPRYEFILKRMIETGSAQEFLEHQLSWFGEIYDEANNITFQSIASAQEDFMEFANSLLGRLIPKDEKELFGIEFFKMHNKAYGLRTKKKGFKSDDNPSRTRVDGYGKSIINEIFDVRKIALVIETDKAGIWKIREK